jgi:octanoyl-[GcvH]:protein N-octanoyltransferase
MDPAASDPFEGTFERLGDLRAAAVPVRGIRVRRAPRCVAFSRRDQNQPGFADAAAAAERLGYRALVRPVGGTFVPLDDGSLVVDEFGFSPPGEWPQDRYRRHVDTLVDVYRGWGIDARVGELPGEYCPGRFSVNHAGRFKISGTAQRVSGGAWLVSTVVRVHSADPLVLVIHACSDALQAGIDPVLAGSVELVAPDLSMDAAARDILRSFVIDGAAPL